MVVEQKIELLEILSGCETANRYNVYLLDKDKNIENTKNIKLETLVLNRSVENDELMSKIMKNSIKD